MTFFNQDGSVYKTFEYNFGDSIELPDGPVRNGYEFTGWTPEASTVSGNMTFTATYKAAAITTTTSAPEQPKDDSKGMSVGIIISVVAVLLLAAAFVAFIIVRKANIRK